MKTNSILLGSALLLLGGITQTTQAQEPKRIEAHPGVNLAMPQQARGLKWKVAIGRFSNETQYGKGIFYDRENDPMAKQALDLLMAKLGASEKFILLERSDADKVTAEVQAGSSKRINADYLILGSITSFGRKTTGSEGLFTSEKRQTVEAGVSVRIIDVSNGQVIFADEAKGNAETTSKSTLGLGGKAGYDATLSDKAISGAIDQLIENIINKCSDKPWRTFLLSADEDGIIIAGGASQGLRPGDTFTVFKQGKQVTNPQTGASFRLAGKPVAQISITSVEGDNANSEYAIATLVSGSFDVKKLEDYYVEPSASAPSSNPQR